MQRSFWGNPSGSQKRFEIFVFTMLVLILASCSSIKEPNQPAAKLTQTPGFTATLTSVPSIIPTPTYLSITPVLQETPLPEYGMPISKGNLDRLTLLSQWGKGNPGSVVFSPDGKYFVVGTATGLYFYDPNDFSLLQYIDTQAFVRLIAVSPDGQKIVAVVTAKVLLYNIPDWQLFKTINIDANSADFSPDGQILALGIGANKENYLQLRDVETGSILKNYRNKEDTVRKVKFSPKGDMIASSGYSTTLWALDGSILNPPGVTLNRGHYITSLSFSPNGEFLAIGSDIMVRIWRVLGDGQVTTLRDIDFCEPICDTVSTVAISPDGTMVAVTTSDGVGAWNISTGTRVFKNSSNVFTHYSSLAWSMDSSTIAAASSETGVMVWNIDSGENLASLNNTTGGFSSLAWSPDGQKLAVGAAQGFAYVFNIQDGNVLQRFGSGYQLNTLAFAPDSQTLAAGYGDLDIQIWDLDGTLLHTLEGFGFNSSRVTYSSDGPILAAILPESWQSGDQIRFLNTDDWRNEKTFSITDIEDFRITGFVPAPDKTTGAISYKDESRYNQKSLIKIISFSDGTTVTTLEPDQYGKFFIDAIAYSPNGNLFAAFNATKPGILVWDTSDWSLLYYQSIHLEPRINCSIYHQDTLAWSSDSKLIAIGLDDSSIRLFNAKNGEALSILEGHNMCVSGVAFSPDGRILASVSWDGTVKLWGLR
jgi:WD40 repeat protein